MEISNPNRAPLAKREVVGPIVQTPGNIKPVGYKWVIVRKQNENDEIIIYIKHDLLLKVSLKDLV